jgi:hypothetical protein
VENVAIVFEHNFGLTCDPFRGLVHILHRSKRHDQLQSHHRRRISVSGDVNHRVPFFQRSSALMARTNRRSSVSSGVAVSLSQGLVGEDPVQNLTFELALLVLVKRWNRSQAKDQHHQRREYH